MCYIVRRLYIRQLRWDELNVAHIARHGVVPDEVEAVCHGAFIHRESYSGRVLIIGPARPRRMLAIVLAPEGDNVYYVVTARNADRKERRQCTEEKGGDRP